MKAFIAVLLIASACHAQFPDDGSYRPDNSGAYNPELSNSGAYVPDNSGAYRPDQYSGAASANAYYRAPGAVGVGSAAFGTFGSAAAPAPAYQQYQRAFPAPAPAAYAPQPVGPAQPYSSNAQYRILKQSQDVGPDGYYWEYQTENRINAQEQGQVANKGTDAEALRANGFYEYTGPDGVLYRVSYTADENGFNPQGAHLPTPPPIPEAIQRSLDLLRSQGKL